MPSASIAHSNEIKLSALYLKEKCTFHMTTITIIPGLDEYINKGHRERVHKTRHKMHTSYNVKSRCMSSEAAG